MWRRGEPRRQDVFDEIVTLWEDLVNRNATCTACWRAIEAPVRHNCMSQLPFPDPLAHSLMKSHSVTALSIMANC